MKLSKLIREISTEFQVLGYSRPIAIEVDNQVARDLQNELGAMFRYATIKHLPHNHCLFNGVLIKAPENFVWAE